MLDTCQITLQQARGMKQASLYMILLLYGSYRYHYRKKSKTLWWSTPPSRRIDLWTRSWLTWWCTAATASLLNKTWLSSPTKTEPMSSITHSRTTQHCWTLICRDSRLTRLSLRSSKKVQLISVNKKQWWLPSLR